VTLGFYGCVTFPQPDLHLANQHDKGGLAAVNVSDYGCLDGLPQSLFFPLDVRLALHIPARFRRLT
jgi:hypothetical protein